MNDNDPVCVATYSSEMSARVAKTALVASGIDSFISSDDCGGLRPHLQTSTGVRLMIRKSDAEPARKILEPAL